MIALNPIQLFCCDEEVTVEIAPCEQNTKNVNTFAFQIFGTELVNNKAQRGGAVDVQNSQTNVLIQNSTFRANRAEYKGSDVYATEIQQLRIANSQFISAASELEVSSIYYHVNTGRTYQSYSVPLRFWNTTFSDANRILVSSSNNFSDVAVEKKLH